MPGAINFFDAPPAANPAAVHITDEAEACAAVLTACLRANELDTENPVFFNTIENRNVFKGRDAVALIATADRYYATAGSPAALIDRAIGAIREQTRLPLFYHCLDVILADGVVTPQEHKVFQYLKGKFRVDDEVAFAALEVLVTKNQL